MTLDAIKLEGIKKSFGTKLILNNINCSFKARCNHMILGHNGAGKTTLLKILSEVLPVSSGRVLNPWSKSIFYLEDIPSIFDDALVSDFINFIKLSYMNSCEQNLDEILVGLFSKKISSLSTGERKKIILAAAIISNAKLVVFDEPTNGLDSDFKKKLHKIFNAFKERGACIIFTTHLVNDFSEIKVEKYVLQNHSLTKLAHLNKTKYSIRFNEIRKNYLQDLFSSKNSQTCLVELPTGQIEATITFVNEMESLNDYLGLLIKNDIEIESVKRL